MKGRRGERNKAASNMQQATSRQAVMGERIKVRKGERNMAAGNKQHATCRQAVMGERMKARKGERNMAAGNKQHATSRQAVMGERMKAQKGERAKGNKQGSSLRGTKQSRSGEFVGVFPLDCFTAFAMTKECMTTTITAPSLRGTKQSSTGEFVGVFLLDCFTAFAMTGGVVASLPCTMYLVPCPFAPCSFFV